MNDDELINQVYRKIERENAIINAANAMRQSSNPQVQHSLDSQVREARKGIGYLEERMRELQLRRRGANSQSSAGNNAPLPPAHRSSQQRGSRNSQPEGPPPPPKDGVTRYSAEGEEYGDAGAGGYMDDLSGGHGMMRPRAPFGPPPPGSGTPKPRSNYTKLGKSVLLPSVQTPKLRILPRSYQIRYALFGSSDSTHVISVGI